MRVKPGTPSTPSLGCQDLTFTVAICLLEFSGKNQAYAVDRSAINNYITKYRSSPEHIIAVAPVIKTPPSHNIRTEQNLTDSSKGREGRHEEREDSHRPMHATNTTRQTQLRDRSLNKTNEQLFFFFILPQQGGSNDEKKTTIVERAKEYASQRPEGR